jgi:hypothetical protein
MNEPEQIERTLSDFFQSEAPKSWPKPPTHTSPDVLAFRAPDPLIGGRIALAASVLVMLIASWWLAGRITIASRPATFEDTSATRPADMRIGK